MVSIRYPSSPGGVDAGSIIDMFNGGFDRAKGLKDERDGISAFGGYLDSIYGAQGRPRTLSDLASVISPSQGQNTVQRAPLPDIATQRVAQAFGDGPSAANGYLSALRGAESSGNDAARNPNSSATGRYQFTEGTWNDLMRQNPQLGLTPDGRTDPEQQDRAIKVFTANNAKQLSRSGIPVNQASLYAAHFLGAGGASNALSKPDQTPMAAVVDQQTLQANPFLQGMTVGDFKQWTAQKMGGQSAPAQVADASGQTGFSAPDPSSILPPRDVMLGLFKSPQTRPFAIQLAQAAQGMRADASDPMAQIKYQTAVEQLRQIQNPQAKPTDDMREYEFAKSQGFDGSFLDFQLSQKKAGATNVNVGGEPSDGALRKKLDEKTGELWSTYQQTGATSAATMQDMQVLDELIKVAPQGPITGRLAEMFPGVSSAGDAFQSIVKRVAPTLRAPGSGATSDIEYDGMLRSLPALRNNPEANAAISQIMKAKAAINVERSGIIDAYGRGDISAGQARSQIAELDKRSILTPELSQAIGNLGGDSGGPMQGAVVDGYRFKGGDPADPNSWEQVQ